MNTTREYLFRKGIFIGKLFLFWLLAVAILFMSGALAAGEPLALLLVDVKSDFADNQLLLEIVCNKLVCLSLAFLLLFLAALVTKDFLWKIQIGKWQFDIAPAKKGFQILCNVLLGGLALAVVFLFVRLQGGELLGDIFAGCDGWQGSALIAHAGGGMEKEHYSNSLKAFEDSYQNGMRTIELDFLVTSDDKLVCGHTWNQQMCSDYEAGYVYSQEEFLNIRIFDQYTPLSLERVFELMKKYEDVYVVTDTKDSNPEEVRRDFEILLETAWETDSMEVLDRLVVQLYNYEMYDVVEEVYSFSSYILTLYKMGGFDEAGFISHCRYCKTKGIDTITMWYYWATPEIVDIADRYGIDIYVHTLNTVDELEKYQDMGVKGFYTDDVIPEMLEQ